MKETRTWGGVIVAAIVLAVAIVVAVGLARTGGWWSQGSPAEPSHGPSGLTLSAASPVTADPVTPVPTSSASLASTTSPAPEAIEFDDVGWQAVEAVALAVTAQPEGETYTARAARLSPLFAPGATTPEPVWNLESDLNVIAHGRVVARSVQWIEPFEIPKDGKELSSGVGALVSVEAQTLGVLDGEEHNGVVDAGDIAWTDTSSQLWEIVMTRQDGRWLAASARLADAEGES